MAVTPPPKPLTATGTAPFVCVRVPWTTTGWKAAPAFEAQKLTAKGRVARRPRPLGAEPQDIRQIARGLSPDAWQKVTWRQGSKGPQTNRFARLSLWAAAGWRQGPQPQRVEETLLLAEWPEGAPEPTRYWLAQTGADLPLAELVAMAKARWRIEQNYRELKVGDAQVHCLETRWEYFASCLQPPSSSSTSSRGLVSSTAGQAVSATPTR